MFSYSGNLKTWIKCQGSPPLHITGSIEVPKRICDFLNFLICFLSMEFIAELPYKSLRLSGCFHRVFCFTIILTAV